MINSYYKYNKITKKKIITNMTKNYYKSYKKLLQKWERQTNKQTKTKYRVKTKQSFCIKTKLYDINYHYLKLSYNNHYHLILILN